MEIAPLGEAACIVRGFPAGEAWKAARRIGELPLPGLRETAACVASVGVYFDPDNWSEEAFADEMAKLHWDDVAPGILHRIPVLLDGEDLNEASGAVHQLFESDLTCWAVGFAPGFPYLGPLTGTLGEMARRSTPRTQVPAGSVAVAAGQACIYPDALPGGWNLVGRTPLRIADASSSRFAISPGDQVRFYEIDQSIFAELEGQWLGELI